MKSYCFKGSKQLGSRHNLISKSSLVTRDIFWFSVNRGITDFEIGEFVEI